LGKAWHGRERHEANKRSIALESRRRGAELSRNRRAFHQTSPFSSRFSRHIQTSTLAHANIRSTRKTPHAQPAKRALSKAVTDAEEADTENVADEPPFCTDSMKCKKV
jgi:hypothetical protein